MTLENTNIAEFLLADKPTGRTALRTPDAEFTYGDLQGAAEEMACALTAAGARKGDRILLLSSSSFGWVAAYLGILRAGLVAVPLPLGIPALELRYIAEHTEARFAFLQTQVDPQTKATLAAAGVEIVSGRGGEHGLSFHFEAAKVLRWPLAKGADGSHLATSAGDLAALMFTSGSTGRARGVMVSHGNIRANTESIIEALQIREDDRIMAVLPFHYCFGTSLLHTYLRAGATLVIDSRFAYPEVVLDSMQRYECTSFAGVPSHYQILLRNSSFTRRRFPHLRSLLQAGGHLAPQFINQLQQSLPHARIFVMYGQTEATARLSCLPPEMLSAKPGSIGKAIPGVKLHVFTDARIEAAPGEIGEIVAEGDNVTQGYWRDPDETALSFHDGMLHTGDLATIDEDGFIFVVDRAKEFLKCGGTRVSCRYLEDRLLECEELLEAAVVGVADEVLGEAVRAFVVPRDPRSEQIEERLQAFCRTNLPRPYIPREIIVVESLPKNTAGKVQRAQLKRYAPTLQPAAANY